MSDTIEGTAEEVDVAGQDDDASARRPTASLAVRPSVAVAPDTNATDLVARLELIKDAMASAMKEGVDYGVIPGTNSKPSLLKPGAEKLGVLFRLDIQITNQMTWSGDHLTVVAHAVVTDIMSGIRVGDGEGLCSTREKKYAVRWEKRTCPHCHKASVIKGKEEYGGGWVCFKKLDGCGAKWKDGDQAIEGQATGEVENPDLPDTWNTVIKMARKRARVDAILNVTGASALFTQDGEDQGGVAPADTPPFGPWADSELLALARPALKAICGGNADAAAEQWKAIRGELGTDNMPQAAAVALVHAAKAASASDPSMPWNQPDEQGEQAPPEEAAA